MLHARLSTAPWLFVIAYLSFGNAESAGRSGVSSASADTQDLPTIIELTPAKAVDTATRHHDTLVRPQPAADTVGQSVHAQSASVPPAPPAVVDTIGNSSQVPPSSTTAKPTVDSVKPPMPETPRAAPTRAESSAVQAQAPGPESRNYSLFDYRKVVSLGPWISYFYYNENIDVAPLVQWFRDEFSTNPKLTGTPKSSEYGSLIGLRLQISRYLRNPNLFIRPGVALLLGIGNTYDGSSMDYDMQSNSIGITFTPVVMQKTNIFLFGSCDMGYSFLPGRWRLTPYTGLDGKLWIRDMTDMTSSSSISSSEAYYWFSVPAGLIVARALSPRAVFGIEPRVDFMFFGQMQVNESDLSSSVNYEYPAVTLGNRASYRLETFLQIQASKKLSLSFSLFGLMYGFGKSNIDTATISNDYQSVKTTFLEPSSATYQVGFTFNIGFLRKRYGEDVSPSKKEGR
jgi:hypothetical protein